jgi:hypothetical protein
MPPKTKKVNKKVKETLPEDECQVCCNALNKSNYKPVVCPTSDCSYASCVTCIKTYLLNNPLSTPHCMACKKPYNLLFVFKHLSKTWYESIYLEHITNIQLDIELSKLSESMEQAEKIKTIETLRKQSDKLADERLKIWNELGKGIDKITKEINTLKAKKTEKKQFVQPCSFSNCNGMLSMQYKCGLCEKYTCKECNEPNLEEHKCNPDAVASNIAIKKDTRPCPSCSARIFKIEGCDQMWCTSCKTPFSWITGNIVPAGQRLHNPHAIDFLKSGGVNVRAPGDLVCGGLISNAQFEVLQQRILNQRPIFRSVSDTTPESDMAVAYLQSVNININVGTNCIFGVLSGLLHWVYYIIEEISNNKLRICRERLQAHTSFNDDRVSYILKLLTKEIFKYRIQKANNERSINTSLSFIWEFVSTFGIEMFAILSNNKRCLTIDDSVEFITLIVNKLIEFNALVLYANSQLAIISVSNSCSIYNINFSFVPENLMICMNPPRSNFINIKNPNGEIQRHQIFNKERYSVAGMNRQFNK